MKTMGFFRPHLSVISSSGEEYKIGEEPPAQGKLSQVYQSTHGEEKVAIKIMKYTPDPDVLMKKTEQEVELLARVYGKSVTLAAHHTIISGEELSLPAIIMPYLEGTLLQDRQNNTPQELKFCSFAQRAQFAYQYFDQLDKLHSPKDPLKKSAIISDLHGGNIIVDFGRNKLELFDFGEAVLVDTTRLQKLPRNVGENKIARSPESVKEKQIGLVSDIFGSVVPLMLIWGANHPDKNKLKHSESKRIIDDEFVETGLLENENINVPKFLVPLDRLIIDFIHRMAAKNPEDRIQFAAEGKEFFEIIYNISQQKIEKPLEAAARLITIASGVGYYFKELFDFQNTKECNEIVNLYNLNSNDSSDCFAELRSRYDARDYVRKIMPQTRDFESFEEIQEIVSSHQIYPQATLHRLQLIQLITDLLESMDKKLWSINKNKYEKLVALKKECLSDYLDVNKTETIFKKVCVAVEPRKSYSETGTGRKLKDLLNQPKYKEFANYIPKKEGQIHSADLEAYAAANRGEKKSVESTIVPFTFPSKPR